MARQNLGNLLSVATASKAPEATTVPAAQSADDHPEVAATPKAAPTRAKVSERAAKSTGRAVRYYELERKETRLRGQQVDELNAVARQLSKKREAGAGERITENTLIRIAVDLLLEQKGKLAGNNEAELRKSIGL